MNYDFMRVELTGKLAERFPAGTVNDILEIVDVVIAGYDVTKKETALSIVGAMPEIIKVYISTKAIEGLTRGTLTNYKRVLTKFFAYCNKPFTDITANDIRVFLYTYKRERRITDSTLNGIRVMINSFFLWLMDEGYIPTNPARKVAPIKAESSKRHSMTPVELEQVRSLCVNKREKAIIDFLFSTGCRASELCNVKLEDVNWLEKTVQIIHGKGGKDRMTYLNAESVVSLQAYINSRKDDCEYLFTTSRIVKQMSKKALEMLIKKITARSQFKTHITPHVFRHTAATVALRNGMPIDQVQRFLGHAKIATTLIYAATDDSNVRASHMKCVS